MLLVMYFRRDGLMGVRELDELLLSWLRRSQNAKLGQFYRPKNIERLATPSKRLNASGTKQTEHDMGGGNE